MPPIPPQHFHDPFFFADVDGLVNVAASSLNLMETPLNKTYSCSVETQIELKSKDDNSHNALTYLRITKVDSLRAFILNGTTPKDESE